MIGSAIRPNKTSLQQLSECDVYEQVDQYQVDCYPYAMRGILSGIFISIGLWAIAIGVLILVF